MSEHQESYPIVTMCLVLGVSPSGYHAWRQRPPSARAEEDAQLRSRIERIHGWSRGTYGAPRIRAELADEGQRVSRKRVARLIKEAGVPGGSRRRRTRTTHREPGSRRAPDRVDRNVTAHRPDQLWVADITYIGTWAGFLYLAVVVDASSRRVVGWAMATHLRTELVIDALNMAIWRRRPEGVIHPSDQGSQYTSIEFGKHCRKAGVSLSMGSRGDCYDNALCESFFATLECELLERSSFRTPIEARMAAFDFVEGFYNPHRRHSSLEKHSPASYERRYDQASAVVETDQALEIAARFPQPLGSRYAAPTVPATPTVTS